MKYIFALLLLLAFGQVAYSKKSQLDVFTCEPEWAALAHSLGGDTLNIDSATTFMQDPHYIQARPSLIAKTRKADLVICTGADLEVGWLPLLLRKSGNPNIQPGSTGYFMATDHVKLLDQSSFVDRSEGDVHGAGNPHIHFDPMRMLQVAESLALVLSEILPDKTATFHANLEKFRSTLLATLEAEKDKIAQLRGLSVVVHHRSWPYLLEWLDMNHVAELEPKPGLPPSTSHLTSLLQQLNKQTVAAIIYASYQDSKPAKWLGKRRGIPVVALPYSVEDWKKPNALVQFYQQLINTLHQQVNIPVNQ